MKTRLEQVLERCLNGREIAVWGSPTRSMLRTLKPYQFHVADAVDSAEHYVVAVTEDDLNDFLVGVQSKPFQYADDYLAFYEHDSSLPFEWECHGIKVGRQTYSSEMFVKGCEYGDIESFGHFTSINSTAMIQHDHPQNMVFMSDDIQEIFTNENKALFKSKKLASHSLAENKNRTKIGNDVWIGAYSFINASKVTSIGDGAIIGAGAVVLEDVPPYAVVVGVPAKIKRYRFAPEIIETLLRVKWWSWSFHEINENADALMSPEIFMERFGHCS